MKLAEAIEKAKSSAKQRKFVQTIEVAINLTGVNLDKPENRVDIEVALPKGRGKDRKIAVICDDEMLTAAKAAGAEAVVTKADLDGLGKDKKKAKKFADEYDVFISQATLMPLVGKVLGQALGPKNKMPKPVPANANLKPLVERMRTMVKIKVKGKNMPVLHFPVGTEAMPTADLVANAEFAIHAVTDKLPQKMANVKEIFIKTSMGPSVKVDAAQ